MSEAQGIPGPVFMKWFGTIFVTLCIGVLIWGYLVAGGVRRTASETDSAMRTVAWNLLRWSTGHDGRFPTSEAEFIDGMRRAVDPPPPPREGGEDLWPANEKTALLGHRPTLLPDALARISVHWPTKPDVAPELGPDGKPTLPGTVEAVRGWLHRWVDAHRPAPPVAPAASPAQPVAPAAP